jgi:RNA polymerase sigma-70 factor (ECF subfamily)
VTEDTASNPGSPTDAQVIEQSLRSPETFATLFDRHADAIYRYAAIRLGTNGAEDVMSETFYLG